MRRVSGWWCLILVHGSHGFASVQCATRQIRRQEPKWRASNSPSEREPTGFLSPSVAWLNVVAVLWGTQHAVIKQVVGDTDVASSFTLLRFGMAALIATPSWILADEDQDLPSLARWGTEMGFWMFLGFAFQAIGLEYTTAQRSGFLLYLNVKIVPFLARVLLRREIRVETWISALVAFLGTALLAGASPSDMNVGDAWSIAAAAASAMFILRLEKASVEVPNAVALNAMCLWIVTGLAGLWTVAQSRDTATFDSIEILWGDHWVQLLYLSGVTTALANWIQTKAQKEVSAERACVIYAMDPVYGAIFASVLLGESLGGPTAWSGAGLITVAAATNALSDWSSRNDEAAKPWGEEEEWKSE